MQVCCAECDLISRRGWFKLMGDGHEESRQQPAESPRAVKTWQSDDLFEGSKLVHIEHAGETYQLRITRQGKLILNK